MSRDKVKVSSEDTVKDTSGDTIIVTSGDQFKETSGDIEDKKRKCPQKGNRSQQTKKTVRRAETLMTSH